jgi:hypothetical protein
MHRKPLLDQANDISASVMERCRELGMPEGVLRQIGAQLLTSEFAEMAAHIQRSLDQHGEITPRCWRYLRENLTDLARNTFGIADVPTNAEATAVAAD